MSIARKLTPDPKAKPTLDPKAKPARGKGQPDVARMNAALRASGIDYQVDGKVDMRAYAEAIAKRFPNITDKLSK